MPVQILRPGPRRRLLIALCATAAATLPLLAGEQVVARIFEHASRLLQEGRPELAVDEYRRLVDSYPQSDLADDALLAIGAQFYSVSEPDGLGRASAAALAQAFAIFDRVRREHPQGNGAPGAIVRMAYSRLEPRADTHNLEEARALFLSVSEIYPESEWLDDARLGMAFCSRRAGAPARVLVDLQPFTETLAASPLAARAHLWRADALEALGRRAHALEAYERARLSSRRAAEASWAQGRALLLMRRALAAQGTAHLVDDPGFSSVPLKEVREASSLHASASGSVYLTDSGRGLTFQLDARGRSLDQKEISAPALMSVDAYGQAAMIEGESLRLGRQTWPLTWHDGKRKVSLRPVVPPLPRRDGSWWFTNERGRAVFEFDRSLVFRKSVWSDDSLSADRARVGPDDTVWLMDTQAGRLVRLAASGEARSVDLKAAPINVRDARDLAVDALGALWVLDAGRRSVAVFSPSGQYEGALRLQGASGSLLAVEVDSGGGLLVYDARERRLRRFVEAAPAVAGAAPEVKR